MKDKAKTHNAETPWTELQEKAKDDHELSMRLEVAKRVIERYSEALRQLADC